MIHLDTNLLILSFTAGTKQLAALQGWLRAGERISIDSVAWAEFLCGPVTGGQRTTVELLFPTIETFGSQDSDQAAILFNMSGRRRGTLNDCMIAAVAMRLGASLATSNASDFQSFVSAGLQLIIV